MEFTCTYTLKRREGIEKSTSHDIFVVQLWTFFCGLNCSFAPPYHDIKTSAPLEFIR